MLFPSGEMSDVGKDNCDDGGRDDNNGGDNDGDSSILH